MIALALSCVVLWPSEIDRQIAFCKTPLTQSFPYYALSTPAAVHRVFHPSHKPRRRQCRKPA